MSTIEAPETLMIRLERAVRETEPAAFLVWPRILRRVIRQDRDLAGVLFQVPHRKSYVIAGERLAEIVAPDELGLEGAGSLPGTAILLLRPDEERLQEARPGLVLLKYWRLLFHARVHMAMEGQLAKGRLRASVVRQRIDRIGQVAFDEIREVLRNEHFLFDAEDLTQAYVEFAAVYLELRHFAPRWLGTYFPSLSDYEAVDGLLALDVDAAAIFAETRLPGAAEPTRETAALPEESPAERAMRQAGGTEAAASPRYLRKLLVRAERASRSGNAVGAALLRLQAARRSGAEEARETTREALLELERLVDRLQLALGFDDTEVGAWRSALTGLLLKSTRGFWSADKRLLYDLQKVCVDHEREIYTVDLLEWMRSGGKRPIKRPLENQREVLMSKHLHTATRRLVGTRLSGPERERLSALLREAARSAEAQLRARLRPLVDEALDERGFTPRNVPERVARKKLIEELLDVVVQRGYLTMGYLRDAVSRSNLKLPDLAGPGELWKGDPLLRTDARLAVLLDGVYHRGEFYLRWLQRLSSAAFGTRTGRFLTQYVAIPFGGSYIVLEGLAHVLKLAMEHPPHLTALPTLIAAGVFLLGLMHAAPFRKLVMAILRGVGRVLRFVFVDGPKWVAKNPLMRSLLHSRPVVLFRRHLLAPLVLTGVFWWALPAAGVYGPLPGAGAFGMLAGLTVVLSSRIGRDVEELTAEWAERTWQRIRVRIFIALYEVIMETFSRFLEWFERVLYAVDEWLRFRSGETSVSLGAKAVLGLVWGVVVFVARFCVNLLIEPQVNPIKHFPVVTVSHKILLPTTPYLIGLLSIPLGQAWGSTIAVTTVTVLPGVFGFLVWELKSNWRLYEANRPGRLQPAIIGSHGETMRRLLRPGFHSGTIPKLYSKLRRAERKAHLRRFRNSRKKQQERLHHVETELRHFVERELIALLEESRGWEGRRVEVGEIRLASNSISIELESGAGEPLVLSFQEQSGWLVATLAQGGWTGELTERQRGVLADALAGFYQYGSVGLVREQIEACLGATKVPYDVSENSLVVWPDASFESEVRYDLERHGGIKPRPWVIATYHDLPVIEAQRLVFRELAIGWGEWVRTWDADAVGGRERGRGMRIRGGGGSRRCRRRCGCCRRLVRSRLHRRGERKLSQGGVERSAKGDMGMSGDKEMEIRIYLHLSSHRHIS